MNIYLVDYWYPESEYGGLQCVVARDADHCVEMIITHTDASDKRAHPDYERRIMNCVAQSKVYKLRDDYAPGVVDSFLT